MRASIYVHIPFCALKCPYCSFPVVIGQQHREEDYLDAVEREAKQAAGMRVMSVYVGGGTPSVLSEAGLTRLSDMIVQNFVVDKIECTLEWNPESVTPNKAALLRSLGFTRASFGVQSFHAEYLSYLGRRHSPDEGFRVFKMLRSAGFDNINVDLMFGFPGQTMAELDEDIDAVLSLGGEHVSLYALTVDPKSVFCVRGEKVSDQEQAVLYQRVCDRLNAAGVLQYEVSNFARPGFESVHNLNYWQGGEYLGLGMGAHSHLHGERFWNADTFPKYLQMMSQDNSAVVGREKLMPPQKMIETFLFGLRMNAGVDMDLLQQRFGCALTQDKVDELENLIEAGFLFEEGSRICATDRGRLVLDEISARLI
jgi:oxygen-independent coproporphyrinogen-3 oxidase